MAILRSRCSTCSTAAPPPQTIKSKRLATGSFFFFFESSRRSSLAGAEQTSCMQESHFAWRRANGFGSIFGGERRRAAETRNFRRGCRRVAPVGPTRGAALMHKQSKTKKKKKELHASRKLRHQQVAAASGSAAALVESLKCTTRPLCVTGRGGGDGGNWIWPTLAGRRRRRRAESAEVGRVAVDCLLQGGRRLRARVGRLGVLAPLARVGATVRGCKQCLGQRTGAHL